MKLQHNLGGLEGLGSISLDRRVFAEDWTAIYGELYEAYLQPAAAR